MIIKFHSILNIYFSEINELLQKYDLKNGIDVYMSDDKYLVLVIYGQGYMIDNQYHLKTVTLKIMPYNENRDFFNIFNQQLRE